MSQGRRARDYSRRRDAQIRNLRGGDGTPAVIAGYLPGNAGRPKPHPGDEKFPFVKDPPDIEGPVRYIPPVVISQGVVQNPIPLVAADADYLDLPEIDTGGSRLLTLFIEFFPSENGGEGRLSLLPQQMRGDSGVWFPMAVVSGELEDSTTVDCGGFRRVLSTELRFNTDQAVAIPETCMATLDFDVTTKANVRFRVGDISQPLSGLNLWYTLGR